MKQLLLISVLTISLLSCTQNDSKQKEPPTRATDDTLKKELTNTDPLPTTTDTTATTVLTVNPQDITGDLGQVTFTQKDKTVFYYHMVFKAGKVVINGKEYSLTKFSHDARTGSYKLSGAQVSISAPNCKYKEIKGTDCAYGKCALVTVTVGTNILNIENVEVQDCL